MGLAITNCVVSKAGVNILTAPTSAELNDDLKPTMNIVITGGTVAPGSGIIETSSYKITGEVNGAARTFLNMVCKKNTSPYKFAKS